MMLSIVIRFAPIAPISARWVVATSVDGTGWGQTNSQWNTMGKEEPGWLTTSTVVGGDGPHGGGDGPRKG